MFFCKYVRQVCIYEYVCMYNQNIWYVCIYNNVKRGVGDAFMRLSMSYYPTTGENNDFFGLSMYVCMCMYAICH